MNNNIKKTVSSFIKEKKLKTINYQSLKNVVTDMGYTVIEFNNIVNEKDVEIVIKNLCLEEKIRAAKGFTYVSKDYRLIFINEDLNNEEKLIVLSHETGHIVCKHFTVAPVIGKDVTEEYEANEFSHYLLNQSNLQKLKNTVVLHPAYFIVSFIIAGLLVFSLTSFILTKQKNEYMDNLYITPTGKRYHEKDCYFIKNNENVKKMTKNKFESGDYTPCQICSPNKQ